MATLAFLDPPRTPNQGQRGDDPRAARRRRIVIAALLGSGLAVLAIVATVTIMMVDMYTKKQAWIASIRAQYGVESLTLAGEPGRTAAVECWSGSTVNLVAKLKNQKAEQPATTTVTVNLSGVHDSWLSREVVEQTIVLPGSAMPKLNGTVDVPFSVDVPPSMYGKTLTWTALATSSGDEPPNRGSDSIAVKPCAP